MEQQQAKTSAGNHSQSAASGSTSSPENKSSQMETIPSPNPTPSSTGDAGTSDPKQLRRSISLLFIYFCCNLPTLLFDLNSLMVGIY